MEVLTNLKRSFTHPDQHGKDLSRFLGEENVASLNNFIRYGAYENGRDHTLNKTRSIADVLMLTDAQCTILLNFIEIVRINKNTIVGKRVNAEDSLVKLLASIQNSPDSLSVYYTQTQLDEEVFYYRLIRDLYKWIISYQEFVKINGINKLYTVGILNPQVFNGRLQEIADIMGNYLVKVKLVYPYSLDDDEKENSNKEVNEELDKKELLEEIRNTIKDEIKGECCKPDPCHKKQRGIHIKHDYEFEHSGFNVPTLIKATSMIHCNTDVNKLISIMNNEDILYLPKTDYDISGHYVLHDMRNILIVSDNTDFNCTFDFVNVTGRIENLSLHYKKFEDKEMDDLNQIAIKVEGDSILEIVDSNFSGYYEGIVSDNYDSFSEVELTLEDCIFNEIKSRAVRLDSVVKFDSFRTTYTYCTNLDKDIVMDYPCTILVTHTNRNKSVISFRDSVFLNLGQEENEKSSIIRLINNQLSSRVGITACYVLDCRFLNSRNVNDILIGLEGENNTDVNMNIRGCIGLNKVTYLVEHDKPETDEKPNDAKDNNCDCNDAKCDCGKKDDKKPCCPPPKKPDGEFDRFNPHKLPFDATIIPKNSPFDIRDPKKPDPRVTKKPCCPPQKDPCQAKNGSVTRL